MVFGACSDIGKVRKANQDYYYAIEDENFKLYIVADGMGGHNAGEVASFMAIKSIGEWIQKSEDVTKIDKELIPRFIEEGILYANSQIYKKASEDSELFGMGTTITLALIIDNNLFLGHVGDSRAYLINDDGILQLTEDHSLVAELYKNGSITLEEAACHPQKHLLTRALGTDSQIKVDTSYYQLKDNDYILLCTDGLTNLISNDDIRLVILSNDIQQGCNELARIANIQGGFDNITVILIKFNSCVIKWGETNDR